MLFACTHNARTTQDSPPPTRLCSPRPHAHACIPQHEPRLLRRFKVLLDSGPHARLHITERNDLGWVAHVVLPLATASDAALARFVAQRLEEESRRAAELSRELAAALAAAAAAGREARQTRQAAADAREAAAAATAAHGERVEALQAAAAEAQKRLLHAASQQQQRCWSGVCVAK